MRQLNGLYTQRFNHAHDLVGHVFQGRFKSISYQATAGEFPAPVFLDVDWLLAQFGKTQSRAKTAYVSFVRDDISDIPKRKKLLRHLPLAEIAGTRKAKGEWMREAYRDHGYTMQVIADFAGLHHSTVSRLIKEGDENAPNE